MTTTQDFDRLSAYLDNQLPVRDRAALEARLDSEPELRATLRDLRVTVQALRAMPMVKPPRSFTLTPDQVGARQNARRSHGWFPALRLATSLSALALVLVLVGDLGSGFLAASPAREAATSGADAAVATEIEPMEQAAPAEAPAPTQTQTTEAEVESLAGADEGDAADVTAEAAMLAPEPAGTATPTNAAERTLPPTAEPSPKVVEPTETPLSVAEAPPSATDDLYFSADTSAEETQVETQPRNGLPTLRLAELGLVLLTVLLGAAAWFSRRG